MVAVVIGIIVWLSMAIGRPNDPLAMIWLPTAVSVARLFRSRENVLWQCVALVGGMTGGTFVAGVPLPAALVVALANAIELLVIHRVMRLVDDQPFSLSNDRQLLAFGISGGAIGPVLSGIIGVPGLTGSITTANLSAWWIAHATGLLLGLPSILIGIDAIEKRLYSTDFRKIMDFVGIIVFTAALSAVVFLQTTYPILFIVNFAVLIAAFRHGLPGTLAVMLTISLISIPATLAGTGPIHLTHADSSGALHLLSFFLISCYATGLALCSARAKTQVALAVVEDARKRECPILSSVHETVFQADAEGRSAFLGGAWSDLTGHPVEPSLGQKTIKYLSLEAAGEVGHLFGRMRDRQIDDTQMELDLDRVDGQIRRIDIEFRALRDSVGDFTGCAGSIRDVTAAHRQMLALPESERRLHTLAELVPVGIFRTSPGGLTTYINKAWLEITGLTRETALGNGAFAVLHDDDRANVRAQWSAAIDRRSPFHNEFRFVRPDGSVRWVETHVLPEFDGAGTMVGFVGVNVDITARKEAEAEQIAQTFPTAAPVIDRRKRPRLVRVNRILLVGDHDTNQELMADLLTRLGVELELAANGADAVKRVRDRVAEQKPFDLVLMDMQMPIMGGPEAAQTIRADGIDSRNLPIVALMANAYSEDVSACRAAGMQDHLVKPVTIATLNTIFARWCHVDPITLPAEAFVSPAVRERYKARRDATLRFAEQLSTSPSISDLTWEDFLSQLHRLAGTAGMFGDGALGDCARGLVHKLRGCGDGDRSRQVQAGLDKLRAA